MRWRLPSDADAAEIATDALLGRFGDMTVGLADVDGRRWIMRDRDWFGWPDPPRFVFFAVDRDSVWAVVDFDDWPRRWGRLPEAPSVAANEAGAC